MNVVFDDLSEQLDQAVLLLQEITPTSDAELRLTKVAATLTKVLAQVMMVTLSEEGQ